MLVEIIVFGLLLLPAAVLWLIPKTRRSGGNAVTAWKCVPPGCGVMLLTPVVMDIVDRLMMKYGSLTFRLLSPLLLFGLVLLLTVPAGVAVIRKLKNYCRKHYPSDQPESGGQFYLVFIALLIAVPVVTVIGEVISFSVMLRSGEGYRGPWRDYPVVHEYGTELAFQERSIHPFLAEYDYRFRFRKDGRGTYQDLWTNTGGRTYFNVFRLKNGRFLFSDKDSDYLVDLKERKVFMLKESDGLVYAAPMPPGPFDWGTGVFLEKGRYYIEIGKHRVEAHPVSDQLADPKYIGCITNRFHAASEKPYRPVEKRFSGPATVFKPGKQESAKQ